FGSCDRVNTACHTAGFEEFVYDPSRAGSLGRNLLSPDLSLGKESFPVKVLSDTQRCDLPENFTYITNNDYSNCRESVDSDGIAMGQAFENDERDAERAEALMGIEKVNGQQR
ncbi:hypothetical protein KIN20_020985, partial [Parelaphostrongylus tenuis]